MGRNKNLTLVCMPLSLSELLKYSLTLLNCLKFVKIILVF